MAEVYRRRRATWFEMWLVLIALLAIAPAPEHSDSPAVYACITANGSAFDEAEKTAKAHHYAAASHLFAASAAKFERCHKRLPQQWNPGDELFEADSLLFAGQAAHLAGDAVRAKRLVRLALARYVALDIARPEPESGFDQRLSGSRETAEDDLKDIWQVF